MRRGAPVTCAARWAGRPYAPARVLGREADRMPALKPTAYATPATVTRSRMVPDRIFAHSGPVAANARITPEAASPALRAAATMRMTDGTGEWLRSGVLMI